MKWPGHCNGSSHFPEPFIKGKIIKSSGQLWDHFGNYRISVGQGKVLFVNPAPEQARSILDDYILRTFKVK